MKLAEAVMKKVWAHSSDVGGRAWAGGGLYFLITASISFETDSWGPTAGFATVIVFN